MKTIEFSNGMQVYSQDGAHMGEIVEVWAQTDTHGALPRSRALFQSYGPIGGTAHLFDTEDGYLQVRQDAFLGFGGRMFHVPLTAVGGVDASQSVMLRAGAAQCETRFTALSEQRDRRAA